MNEKPVATLRKLIQQHGNELADDSRRTEALLNDLCPGFRREVFVLVNAQRQQVPAELLSAPRWMPAGAMDSRLSRRLQKNLAFSEEASEWAVRSWAVALGIRDNGAGGVAGWLGRAYSPKRPRPVQKHDNIEEPRSEQDSVQSSVHIHSRTETAAFLRDRSGLRAHTWIVIATVLLAVVWVSAAGVSWNTAFEPLNLFRSPSRMVERAYIVPRVAWVNDGPLLVRSGPSTSHDYLSMLNTGESVRVKAFSPDVRWSQIDAPAEGWVNNQFLNFLVPSDPELTVRLDFQEMIAATDDVAVFASPDANSKIVAHLAASDEAVSIAVTADGQWRQISRPVSGWVAAAEMTSDAVDP